VNEPTEADLRQEKITWTTKFWHRWLVEHRPRANEDHRARGDMLIREDPEYWYSHSMTHLYEESKE
jgi:hypothetical protein